MALAETLGLGGTVSTSVATPRLDERIVVNTRNLS